MFVPSVVDENGITLSVAYALLRNDACHDNLIWLLQCIQELAPHACASLRTVITAPSIAEGDIKDVFPHATAMVCAAHVLQSLAPVDVKCSQQVFYAVSVVAIEKGGREEGGRGNKK